MNERWRVIAIDGPAGSGKSTVARAVAEELGFDYLDTGAMYRAVALAAKRSGQPAAQLAEQVEIAFADGKVLLDGEDVSQLIRSEDISQAASRVSAEPRVRAALVAQQQRILAAGNITAEGRDIGTRVAPQAALKIFLSADPAERARRRAVQLGMPQEQVAAQMAERDERDSSRAADPLRPAQDAVILDSTALSLPQVVAQVIELARQRGLA